MIIETEENNGFIFANKIIGIYYRYNEELGRFELYAHCTDRISRIIAVRNTKELIQKHYDKIKNKILKNGNL